MGPGDKIKLFRIEGWERRLADYIDSCASRTFDRGAFDCVRFTSQGVKQVLALDLAAEFSDKYRNDEEARALVKSFGEDGFFRVIDEICTRHGLIQTNWKRAHRGDPCFIPAINEERWAGGLALSYGAFAYAPSPNKTGLVTVPLHLARAVWHIEYPFSK